MKWTESIILGTVGTDPELMGVHRYNLLNEWNMETENQNLQALGTLANSIAHDFNNIIGIIAGNAELVVQSVPELDRNPWVAELEKRLRKILNATDFAKGLIKQIFDFSKNQVPAEKPVFIGFVVWETLDLLRSSLPHNIEIRERIKDDAGSVRVKPTPIQQVIVNLCKNAIQSMRDTGGVLDVRLENETIGKNQDREFPGSSLKDFIKLTVKDTGCGMTPEETERVFDIHYTTRKDGEGTGLGLTIVHNIVKNYGGNITVSSKPGKGTIIEILLPIEKIELGSPEIII